jgi:hypothetical protein
LGCPSKQRLDVKEDVTRQLHHPPKFSAPHPKTRVEAETTLKRVLVDEPGWREVLHVEPVELVTGSEI